MKLSVVVEGYLLDKRLRFSPNTITNYQYVFRRLVEVLGDVEIDQVASTDIRRFLEALRVDFGLSRRSVHDAWIPLSSLWTWAQTELGVAHVIRGKVAAPEYTKRTIEPFTQDELRRLIRATEYTQEWTAASGKRTRTRRPTAKRDKAIVIVLVDTGLRANELCALAVADYEAQRGRLHVREGKGDKQRFVVAGSRSQRALWLYLAERGRTKPTDPLFATREGGLLERGYLYHLCQRLGEVAGVSNAHPHRFRHTFAIMFLRNGGSPLLLKELLGHEDLSTVLNYVKLAEQDLDAGQRHSPADGWRL